MSLTKRLHTLLRTTPLRYQVQGVRFIEHRSGNAILGDDMGLGKTYQILAWLVLHPEIRPVVVVCPPIAKWVWREQAWTHARLRTCVLCGQTPYPIRHPIAILNFDILPHWEKALLRYGPKALVIDEAHRLQNRNAIRTISCRAVAHRTPHILALTGTPIRNRPIEFFPMLNLVDPKLFPSFLEYAYEFCDPKPGRRGGVDYRGATNLDRLHLLVSRVMIRRTKREVMKDLPRKTYSVIPVDINNLAEYEQASTDFARWYRKTKGEAAGRRAASAVDFVKVQALLSLVGEGKIPVLKDWIQNWLYETNQKLVVFTRHVPVINTLCRSFPGACRVDGTTSTGNRSKVVRQFQDDKKRRLFFGNIQAAGEGITLTAASAVLFAELSWTPAEHVQAEDRVLRIGQKASHVDIYYMVARGTIEEKMLATLDQKRRITGHVVDGTTDLREVALKELLYDQED